MVRFHFPLQTITISNKMLKNYQKIIVESAGEFILKFFPENQYKKVYKKYILQNSEGISDLEIIETLLNKLPNTYIVDYIERSENFRIYTLI